MSVMVDLMVVGLHDVGCRWANVNILLSPLVGLKKAP